MRTIVVDMRHGSNLEKMDRDDKAAKIIGEAAVSGTVWNTEQQLGEHVLEKLYEAGFYVMRVLK